MQRTISASRMHQIYVAFIGALVCSGLSVFGLISPAQALTVPAAPPLDSPVVDQTGTLTQDQISELSDKITKTRQTKSYQIGILLIPTLGQDEYLEGYALKVARQWGIGDKDADNGVLLLIVKDDRKVRIEVGRGLEGELTDLESGRIIKNTLAPAFRQGEYYQGVNGAVDDISAQVEGRASDVSSQVADLSHIPFEVVMFLLVIGASILSWVASMFARTKSWWAGGALGGAIGLIVCILAGWVIWAMVLGGFLIAAGLILDYLVSRNYHHRVTNGENPSWWAGGPWVVGSSENSRQDGSRWDGFGGGGFSGGGSSGDW